MECGKERSIWTRRKADFNRKNAARLKGDGHVVRLIWKKAALLVDRNSKEAEARLAKKGARRQRERS